MTPVKNSRYFVRVRENGQFIEREFCEFAELAIYLYNVAHKGYALAYWEPRPVFKYAQHKNGVVVTSTHQSLLYRVSFYVEIQLRNGHYLSPQTFIEQGAKMYHRKRKSWRSKRYDKYPGYGPVPGVSSGRYHRGSYYRLVGTMPERRMNDLVLVEEGEVAARPCRSGRNLPSTWDDIYRFKEKCWKSQHKGRKAWTRGR